MDREQMHSCSHGVIQTCLQMLCENHGNGSSFDWTNYNYGSFFNWSYIDRKLFQHIASAAIARILAPFRMNELKPRRATVLVLFYKRTKPGNVSKVLQSSCLVLDEWRNSFTGQLDASII